MDKLNISKILISKRREKGLTQENIADYLGVSKASVSKWETGQSYPDILLLPEIATYFNISIDELFGYSPQLSLESIKSAYEDFGKRFSLNDYEEIINEIESMIRKYYSCYRFILAMSQWFLNYGHLIKDDTKKDFMLNRSQELATHVLECSKDTFLLSASEGILAVILFYKKEYEDCLNLLGKDPKIVMDTANNSLLSHVYLTIGDMDKAKEIGQINIFQSISALVGSLLVYQSMNMDNKVLNDTIYNQITTLIDVFDLEKNCSNVIFATHIVAANCSVINNMYDEAMERLNKYLSVIQKIEFPLVLNRNEYFNLIDRWIDENSFIGNLSPTSENHTKTNFIDGVLLNIPFDLLKDREDYQILISKLKELKNE